jgi:thioredoxin 1
MQKLQLRTCASIVSIFLVLASLSPTAATESLGPLPEVPVKGMVTMLDLGAKKCIPCKMMAPIMEKMERVYRGKAAIVFIDVWEHHDQVQRFSIRAIPTQIFFNEKGEEVFRHVGFMSEKDIVKQLKNMGVN